jgi:hypothetical protein
MTCARSFTASLATLGIASDNNKIEAEMDAADELTKLREGSEEARRKR